MDERRRLCARVLEEGWSIAAASREAGVSRQTGSMWVARAREMGLEGLKELSRRPHTTPHRTPPELEAQLLAVAEEHPFWGPRKLLPLAFPKGAPFSERTAARILERAGRRIGPPNAEPPETTRFERAQANELWQMDFKIFGPRRAQAHVLTVIDDATRFLIHLQPSPGQTTASVQTALWEAFGECGLPLAILSDNGSAFRNNATWRWSTLDLWLMLLGIRPLHGRPYHPQTQGKVERLHGTLVRERIGLDELEAFRIRYNWVRPHDALGLKTPGLLYQPSPRLRPEHPPEPWFTPHAKLRRTDEVGAFSFKGAKFKAGRAFGNSLVGIVETEDGLFLEWAGHPLAPLHDFAL